MRQNLRLTGPARAQALFPDQRVPMRSRVARTPSLRLKLISHLPPPFTTSNHMLECSRFSRLRTEKTGLCGATDDQHEDDFAKPRGPRLPASASTPPPSAITILPVLKRFFIK